jgi:tetratricopeptide (TPR) repeat protein
VRKRRVPFGSPDELAAGETPSPTAAAPPAEAPSLRPPRIFRITAPPVPPPDVEEDDDDPRLSVEAASDADDFAFLDGDEDEDVPAPVAPAPAKAAAPPSAAPAREPPRGSQSRPSQTAPPADPAPASPPGRARHSFRRAARQEDEPPPVVAAAAPLIPADEPADRRLRAAKPAAATVPASAFRTLRMAATAAAERADGEALSVLVADYLGRSGLDDAERIELCRALAPAALTAAPVRRIWLKLLRDLDKLVDGNEDKAKGAVRAMSPVLRATALWPLAEPQRREAARLLLAINPYTAIAKALSEDDRDRLALFPLLYGEGENLERTIRYARKRRRIGRIAALAVKQVRDGVLTVADVLAVDALLENDPRFLKGVATAIAASGSFEVAMQMFVDPAAPASTPAVLRGLVEQFYAAGEPQLIERILARSGTTGGAEAGAVVAAAARRLGLPTLALARTVARSGAGLDAATCLALHHDLLAAGHAREAQAVLSAHAGTDADATHRACKMAERLETPEAALAQWRQAEERWPEPRFKAGVGRSLAASLRLAEAEDVLWGLADTQPGRSGHWRDLARAFQEIGDWEAWGDCLAEARRANPDDPWLAHAERWAESERGRTVAITDDPATALDDIHSARMLAGRLLIEGRAGDAVVLRRAVLERTQDRRDHHHYALALFQAGRFDEAAAEVERCIARFPGEAHLYVKRAQVRERRLDWAAALEAYVQAQALDRGNAEAAPGVARCLAYLGRTEALETWLRRFPGGDPRFGWVHALRAFGAAMAGRAAEARDALEPLYASFRALRDDYETAMRRRPATVWTPDGPRIHPLRRADECNARFLDILGRVEQAAIVVLVGNAPTVLGSKLGRTIDAHDCVIRLNDFRTTGFEADVGRKTSLWYTRAHRLARPDPGSLGTAHILAQNDTLNQYPPVDEYLKGRLRVDVPFERATFLPSYAVMATDGATYTKPTTGFRIIQFLEFFCQRAYDIAGFAFFKGSGMHYFDVGEDRLQVGEMHAIDFERDFVERVLCEGRFLKRL